MIIWLIIHEEYGIQQVFSTKEKLSDYWSQLSIPFRSKCVIETWDVK